MRLVLLVLLLAAPALHAQTPFEASTLAAVRAVPAVQVLADSALRVVNLYRAQALVLGEAAGLPAADLVDRLTQEVYAPYTAFWNGYLGGEADFRQWAAESLLDSSHVFYARLAPLTAVPLDSLFEDAAAWLMNETGRRPEGTWYLVFGPGWTNMGGLGGDVMVVDFTRMVPDAGAIAAVLPHEVAHQVHGPALDRLGDPGRGTVLHRIVSEGLATYAAAVHAGAPTSEALAKALWYDDAAWAWAVAHESDLWAAVQPLLPSTARADLDRVASRSEALVAGGPTAAGYFLGVRLVEAYVARHGADGWKDLFDLPVGEVLARSGYAR